ncbi:MAG: double-strand break repair helicase AddA [Pseudomonadota bacterium]
MIAFDPQILASDPKRSVFVTANAGSGKTTTLVNRVARLLLNGVEPGEILCVTYTKAAAAEMQARLFGQLGRWAVLDDAELSQALAALDDSDPAAMNPDALRRARRLFARALETPGGLKIQTIHAFCEKLLRRFPIEAGVAPNFTVLENEAARVLSKAARDDLARAALKDREGPIGEAYAHFAVALDWKRFEALLALIEADRDKLAAYVEAMADGSAPDPYALVGADPDVTPDQLEAAFLDRIDRRAWADAAAAMAAGSTNDRACAERMRAAVDRWTFGAVGAVFLTGTGEARKTMATAKAPASARNLLEDLQLVFLAAQDAIRSARVADDTKKVLTLARAHAALYEQAKRVYGALDFSDLVSRTADLLTRRATAAWVLYKLDGGIRHVLIDEAQDTAPDQWAIVRALTGEFFAGDPEDRTVFVVGDEKQSIYSFQGARPERLAIESQAYDLLVTGADGVFQHVQLAASWRSTPEVLSFVDTVFEPYERTIALVGESVGDFPRHVAKRAGQAGSVELWPLYESSKPPEPEAWDPVDQEPETSGRKALAAALAAEIKRQVETGVAVHARDGLRPAGYGDFLILVRRRDATFEEIIRALKTAGVPVAGADRLKLSSHIVFDDLKSLARFALFPDDDLSLAEVLRSPFCDVEDFGPADSLYELAGREKRRGLWRELQARAGEHASWTRARDLMQAMVAARDGDPFAFFSLALNRVDDTGVSGRARILRRLGKEAEEAIDESLNQVLAAEDRGGTDLETNLALLEAADVEVKRELEGPRGEVRVMTVHGAKGLEAPVVILPDTTARAKPQGPGLTPVALDDTGEREVWLMCPGAKGDDCPATKKAREARADRTDAESLRLLYVALTRARDRLIVMGRAAGNSKTGFEDNSWWHVLDETVGRLDPAQVETLDSGVRRFGPAPVTVARTDTAPPAPPALPGWARQAPPVDHAARFVAPSQMDEALRIPAPSPLAVAAGPGAPLGRFRRGDLIHRLLERLPEIAPDARPDAATRMLARERDLDDAQRDEMIAAAFGVLDDPRFAPVFGPGSRAEVAVAGRAPELPAGVVISGRLDRLVVTTDRVLVVDYKTNRPAPASVEGADPAYIRQLAVYVAVLKALYPQRTVEAALVWTDGPQLMPVPQALMDQALASAR